jgi:hypothetical protein
VERKSKIRNFHLEGFLNSRNFFIFVFFGVPEGVVSELTRISTIQEEGDSSRSSWVSLFPFGATKTFGFKNQTSLLAA